MKELLDKLQRLYEMREMILESGEIAPEGAWIHEYDSVRRSPKNGEVLIYRYAKWQSKFPIFARNPRRPQDWEKAEKSDGFTAHQYIGRVGSSTGLGAYQSVADAYAALARRERLQQIDKALVEIEEILERVMPEKPNNGITKTE